MKKVLGFIAVLLLSAAAFGQTYSIKARASINAGQCVAMYGTAVAPCNNYPFNGFPPIPIGVATTSVVYVRGAANMVTVQYAGIATVPDTSYGGINPGDLLGDVDGTGNLNDFEVPAGGAVIVGIIPQTYVGIAASGPGGEGGLLRIIVQPGFVPAET